MATVHGFWWSRPGLLHRTFLHDGYGCDPRCEFRDVPRRSISRCTARNVGDGVNDSNSEVMTANAWLLARCIEET